MTCSQPVTPQLRHTVKFFNKEEWSFTDHTLVLPAVSVGNVGQLATDLLLENLDPRPCKIGQLFHTALEPVVGNSGNGNLMTACELFHHAAQKILILQFHSPVTRKNLSHFVEFLVSWIHQCGFKDVMCLSSSLASLRNDIQLNQTTMRYLAGTGLNPSKLQQIHALGWTELEAGVLQDEGNNGVSVGVSVRIPGGGIARDFFVACNSAQIPILTLVFFASDGDNTPESMTLLDNANQLCQFIPPSSNGEVRFKIPSSWGYFNGGTKPAGIF